MCDSLGLVKLQVFCFVFGGIEGLNFSLSDMASSIRQPLGESWGEIVLPLRRDCFCSNERPSFLLCILCRRMMLRLRMRFG